jgi:Ca2+-transporting ATPase
MSKPHTQPPQDVASELSSDIERGLTGQEAAARLNRYGKNTLKEEKEIRFLGILKEEIAEPMILLLIAIGVIYSLLGV